MNKKKKISIYIIFIITSLTLVFLFINGKILMNKDSNPIENTKTSTSKKYENSINLNNIPEFSGKPYIIINNNKPYFSDIDLKPKAFEKYSELDYLGRCGKAYACLSKETMPKEKRGNIGNVNPSGWQTIKYDNIDGKYLYNRCHLIGWQLSAENANYKNLITGIRYLNTKGMLPFENMVSDYIKETNNHILYRITPIFKDDNLVANGVLMEAKSVEDNGNGIEFCVYCYNVQPNITIDYKNGNSKKTEAF